MGAKTGIEWTARWNAISETWIEGSTWNYLRGCSRTIAKGAPTSGCGDGTGGGCYAERTGGRFCGEGLPYEGLVRITAKGARWTGRIGFIDKHLLDPLRWSTPRNIFVASVSDPFFDKLTNEQIAIGYGVMAVASAHTYQQLTKRAERMPGWYEWVVREAASANAGNGMTPAAFCFLMLQRYVLSNPDKFSKHERHLVTKGDAVRRGLEAPWPLPNLWLGVSTEHQWAWDERVPALLACPAAVHMVSAEPLIGPIDMRGMRPGWVIAGCESGPGSRECKPEWLRELRDQCSTLGVPYFLKQAVRHTFPKSALASPVVPSVEAGDGSHTKPGQVIGLPYLDGVQHANFPEGSDG